MLGVFNGLVVNGYPQDNQTIVANFKPILMNIIRLKERQDISGDIKLNGTYSQFREFLSELEKKQLSQNIVDTINAGVTMLNTSLLSNDAFRKQVKQTQTTILKQVEKELKIVPKNYYRNLWMLLGFTAFGLPIGTVFGLSMGNMGLMSIGLPIGLAIGAAVGSSMDKKALEEGRQLNLELKY